MHSAREKTNKGYADDDSYLYSYYGCGYYLEGRRAEYHISVDYNYIDSARFSDYYISVIIFLNVDQ